MNGVNSNRIFLLAGVLLAIIFSGCATLPNENVGNLDHRQVEYSLIRNKTGSTTAVFENGLDGKMIGWNKVIPEISKDATTFAYNRPGYGRSTPAATPRDGLHITKELRSLLRSRGLMPPYVLVGYSLGGLYMQLYARRYPEEVAGLVLVDSVHPDQFKGRGASENWPAWFRVAFYLYLSSTARKEMDLVNTTGSQVMALPTFTGKPSIVLSALRRMKEKSELADYTNEKRKDIVRLYPGAKQVWVDSGHSMPHDSPESVIEAIRKILHSSSVIHTAGTFKDFSRISGRN
jgi:pimeloyl-ACP methyl ester carboxylesterase